MNKQEAITRCRVAKEQGDINEFYVGYDCIYVRATEDSEWHPVWPEPEWSPEFDL